MRLGVLAAGIVGIGLAGLAYPRADSTRIQRSIDRALIFAPDGETLRIAASGFHEPVADVLWMRAALVFGERYQRDTDPSWRVWLRRTVEAVNTLDPRWRTPYYYGGLILNVLGDVEASDAVFLRAHAQMPEDWFFAFQLGMNAYLHREDYAEAARWLAKASRMPGAPKWYAAAAAAMQQQQGERRAAMRFLEETLETTDDPGIRHETERQLARLRHNELVDRWDDACRAYRARTGRPLARPEDLAELGFELPPNPRGDAWVVGADGVVRSEGAERERYRRALRGELRLAGP